MLVNRRGILLGLGSLLAAPAVVHVQNLMPIRGIALAREEVHPFLRVDEAYKRAMEAIAKELYEGRRYIGLTDFPQLISDRWENYVDVSIHGVQVLSDDKDCTEQCEQY